MSFKSHHESTILFLSVKYFNEKLSNYSNDTHSVTDYKNERKFENEYYLSFITLLEWKQFCLNICIDDKYL